jgi:hypothetical protein
MHNLLTKPFPTCFDLERSHYHQGTVLQQWSISDKFNINKNTPTQTLRYYQVILSYTILGEIISNSGPFLLSENTLMTQYGGNYVMKNVTLFN